MSYINDPPIDSSTFVYRLFLNSETYINNNIFYYTYKSVRHTFYFDAPMVGMAEVTFGNLQDAIFHAQKNLPTRRGRAHPRLECRKCIKNNLKYTLLAMLCDLFGVVK